MQVVAKHIVAAIHVVLGLIQESYKENYRMLTVKNIRTFQHLQLFLVKLTVYANSKTSQVKTVKCGFSC